MSLSVVMVTANFFPHIGGSERQALEISRALARRGHSVTVLTRRPPGLPETEILDGVRVRRLSAAGRGMRDSLSFMRACLGFLFSRRAEYGIVHAHMASSPAVAAALAARLLGKRAFVKIAASREYGDIALSRRTLAGRAKLWLLARLKPALIAISGEVAAEIAASPLRALRVVRAGNGVDTERFAPASPEEKRAARASLGISDGPVFLFAGRLTAQKNLKRLFAAWSVADVGPARLVLAGSGELEQELRRAAPRGVTLAGPAADMRPYYAAADVFVLPSLAEGMSNALLEAMSCGLPVLASDIGGTRQAVADGVNGVLFPPEDEARLRAGLEFLARDSARAALMGAQSRAAAVGRFSIASAAERLERIYSCAE